MQYFLSHFIQLIFLNHTGMTRISKKLYWMKPPFSNPFPCIPISLIIKCTKHPSFLLILNFKAIFLPLGNHYNLSQIVTIHSALILRENRKSGVIHNHTHGLKHLTLFFLNRKTQVTFFQNTSLFPFGPRWIHRVADQFEGQSFWPLVYLDGGITRLLVARAGFQGCASTGVPFGRSRRDAESLPGLCSAPTSQRATGPVLENQPVTVLTGGLVEYLPVDYDGVGVVEEFWDLEVCGAEVNQRGFVGLG